MCGIVGLMDPSGVEAPLLDAMRDSLAHRGPDDAGSWIDPAGVVGLAHRRLSILDLSEAGRQPMSDPQGRLWILLNGEIYNYLELRAELEALGRRFRSQTDTEVALHAFAQWGEGALGRFNGMFAIAWYDRDSRELVLARDRIGKKPLYYGLYGSTFAFASELKALRLLPGFRRDVDPDALNAYLALGYVGGERTIFAGTRKLPPAHLLVVRPGRPAGNPRRYWTVPPQRERLCPWPERVERLDALLGDAVRLRFRSDVPVGIFLSGGVDSSLVAAYAARVLGGRPRTFTVGFTEGVDERPWARAVADHLGTDHAESLVGAESDALVGELIHHYDEPFADTSAVPTYLLCREARREAKVVLSGDGGDEVFGGYAHYPHVLEADARRRWLPGAIRRALASAPGISGRWRGEFALDLAERYAAARVAIPSPVRAALLSPDVRRRLEEPLLAPERRLSAYVGGAGPARARALMRADLLDWLVDDVLTKVDRASMKVGLEVRCPLLDYRVVEFAYRELGDDDRVREGRRRRILRPLLDRMLPPGFDADRKQGFGMPEDLWRRSMAREIEEAAARGSALLERRAVRAVLGGRWPGRSWIPPPWVEVLSAWHVWSRGLGLG